MAWAKVIDGVATEIDTSKPLTLPGPDQIIHPEIRDEDGVLLFEAVMGPGEVTYSLDLFELAIKNEAGWAVQTLADDLNVFQIIETNISPWEDLVSSSLVWDAQARTVTRVHTTSDKPLQVRKDHMRLQINSLRDSKIDAGFDFGGNHFQVRESDQINITATSQLAFAFLVAGGDANTLRWADANNDFTWIAADNTIVNMSASQMFNFGKAALNFKKSCVYHAFDLKATVAAATTHAELDVIDPNSNWPTS